MIYLSGTERAVPTDRPPVCGWEAEGSAARLTLPRPRSPEWSCVRRFRHCAADGQLAV